MSLAQSVSPPSTGLPKPSDRRPPKIGAVPPWARPVLARLHQGWRWLETHGLHTVVSAKTRRLRVRETVSLGEKRILAIVAVDGVEYLIGGGTASLSLLTPLPCSEAAAFQDVLNHANRQVPHA